MKIKLSILVFIGACVSAPSGKPSVGPVKRGDVIGGYGISQVIHTTEMTGKGTVTSPLGFRTDCSAGQVQVWNGSTWGCGSAGISGSGTTNKLAKWSSGVLTDSNVTDTGSAITLGVATTASASLSVATGVTLNTTSGTTGVTGHGSTAGDLSVSDAATGLANDYYVGAAISWTGSMHEGTGVGSAPCTGGFKCVKALSATIDGTSISGIGESDVITWIAGYFDSQMTVEGGTDAIYADHGDVKLNQSSGNTAVGGQLSVVGQTSLATGGAATSTGGSMSVGGSLSVVGDATITGKASLARVKTPICMAGTFTTGGGPINDWSPGCLATNTTIEVQSGDNNGSVITGIDATSAQLGDWIEICNTNGPQDDGALALVAESSLSLAANRIWTPDYGRNTGQTPAERYTIGPSACVRLIRFQPDQLDATTVRWLVMDSTRRTLDIVKLLQLFPYSQPAAITGTVNDYDADDACAALGGPVSGTCEAAGSVKQTTYSVILMSTVDGTGATVTGLKYVGSVNGEGHGPVKWIYNLGPGPITLKNGCGGSSSTSINQFCFVSGGSNLGDVVLNGGAGIWLWHQRDTGFWLPMDKRDYYFNERTMTVSQGLNLSGRQTWVSGITGALFSEDTTGSNSVNKTLAYFHAGGSETSSGVLNEAGRFVADSTVGLNAAIEAYAANGATNLAIAVTGGELDAGGKVTVGGDFNVGGSRYGGVGSSEFSVANATGNTSVAGLVNLGSIATPTQPLDVFVSGVSKFVVGTSSTTVADNLHAEADIVMDASTDTYIVGSSTLASGNQNINISAGGTGKIRFQTGTGSVTNSGTGGLELDGGGSSTSAVWLVTNAGNMHTYGTSTLDGLVTTGSSGVSINSQGATNDLPSVVSYHGDPNTHVTANEGSISLDGLNNAVWVNTNSATAWSKIASTTGVTGSLTSQRIPVATGSATLGNSDLTDNTTTHTVDFSNTSTGQLNAPNLGIGLTASGTGTFGVAGTSSVPVYINSNNTAFAGGSYTLELNGADTKAVGTGPVINFDACTSTSAPRCDTGTMGSLSVSSDNNTNGNTAYSMYLGGRIAGGAVKKMLRLGGDGRTYIYPDVTTTQVVLDAKDVPTVNHGTLSADASNLAGRITSIGANTSFTITFGGSGFANFSHCTIQPNGSTATMVTMSTVSATAPAFSCFDQAGSALNCPDVDYICTGN